MIEILVINTAYLLITTKKYLIMAQKFLPVWFFNLYTHQKAWVNWCKQLKFCSLIFDADCNFVQTHRRFLYK